MKNISINPENTGYYSSIYLDYLKNSEKLNSFISYPPNLNGLNNSLAGRKVIADRSKLVSALTQQYSKLKISDKLKENINLLSQDDSYTITTGQQVHIFLGPLYVIYKAISAIRLANKLSQLHPNKKFVPVFWMAGEDHDFEEISYINLFNKQIKWDKPENFHGPVGRLKTDSLLALLEEIKSILGPNYQNTYLLEIFEKAYSTQSNLNEATRYIINELLGEQGLIVLNPDDVLLKSQISELIVKDLNSTINSKEVINTTNELINIGYKSQLSPKEFNFFLFINNNRERLDFLDEETLISNVSGQKFSKSELVQLAQKNPELFSPNVITRPMYQETILPNLAYIGGPGEIAYWLQLKNAFINNHIDFPVLIPRDSHLIIPARVKQKMDELGLALENWFLNVTTLEENYLREQNLTFYELQEPKNQINRIFDQIAVEGIEIDKSLETFFAAEKHKLEESIQKWEQKIVKSQKNKFDQQRSFIQKTHKSYFDKNQLQERFDNIFIIFSQDLKTFLLTLLDKPIEELDFEYEIHVV